MKGQAERSVLAVKRRQRHLSKLSKDIHTAIMFLQNCFLARQSLLKRIFVPATSQVNFFSSGLGAFRDTESVQTRMAEAVGRSWSVKELRRKSFEDLHKLWYVLYKERNMLLTESNLARRKGIIFPQPDRKTKVKKSMAAIKTVLGERKRERISQFYLRRAEQEEQNKEIDVEVELPK